MGLAGIDDALELGIRQQAVRDDGGRQMRAIARLGRRDGRHGRRLHEPRRMRLGVGDTDRLEGVALIERLADAPVFGGSPVARVIDELDGVFWSRKSEERSEGNEGGRPGRTLWSASNYKKKITD